MPRLEVREVLGEERARAEQMIGTAFGFFYGAERPRAPQSKYGAFDSSGLMVGTAAALNRHHWWGGRLVPAADVAEVAVLPEARGRGAARALLGALLEGARERGAAVSTLFPTVATPYRQAGWVTVGARRSAEIPTALLPGRPGASGVSARPGDAADRDAAGRLYTEVARARNGMQSRDTTPFGPTGFLDAEVDGLTVVEADGRIVGFASWGRGSGHGEGAVLAVVDLVAGSREAARELIAGLASWRSVAPTTRFRALLSGVVSEELPLEAATRNRLDPLMHRLVDVARAAATRGWPATLETAIDLRLVDEVAPWNSGSWRLEISGGRGRMERGEGEAGPRLDVRGLTLLWAGVASPGMLVEAGLAELGSEREAAALARLAAAPPPESLDFF